VCVSEPVCLWNTRVGQSKSISLANLLRSDDCPRQPKSLPVSTTHYVRGGGGGEGIKLEWHGQENQLTSRREDCCRRLCQEPQVVGSGSEHA
jgi:hypothetical protein